MNYHYISFQMDLFIASDVFEMSLKYYWKWYDYLNCKELDGGRCLLSNDHLLDLNFEHLNSTSLFKCHE